MVLYPIISNCKNDINCSAYSSSRKMIWQIQVKPTFQTESWLYFFLLSNLQIILSKFCNDLGNYII